MIAPKRFRFFLLLLFLLPASLAAHPFRPLQAMDRSQFYGHTGLSAGIYKGSFAYGLAFYCGYKRFAISGWGIKTFPVYWKRTTPSPNHTLNYYHATNALSLGAGYRAWENERNGLVTTIGLVYQQELAYYWPDKGSGARPFFASGMERDKSADSRGETGISGGVEFIHAGLKKRAGLGLLLFAVWTPGHFYPGITLQFHFGALR